MTTTRTSLAEITAALSEPARKLVLTTGRGRRVHPGSVRRDELEPALTELAEAGLIGDHHGLTERGVCVEQILVDFALDEAFGPE